MAIVAKLDRHGNEYWTEDGTEPLDMQRSNGVTTTDPPMINGPLANIPPDAAVVAQTYMPQRKDFDRMRDDIAAIRPQQMTATISGKELAELAADYDHRAKAYIDEADKAFKPLEDAARDTLNKIRDLHSNIVGTAQQVRVRARELLSAHQMSIQRKIDDERREAERKQRELAEAERAAQLAELHEREAAAKRDALALRDAAAREEAAREAGRLAAEASEVAAQPPVPAAVSTTALAERHSISGITGTTVFHHSIAHWRQFCATLGAMVCSIKSNENHTRVSLPGIVIDFNFTKLKTVQEALPGMQAVRAVETRNLRK